MRFWRAWRGRFWNPKCGKLARSRESDWLSLVKILILIADYTPRPDLNTNAGGTCILRCTQPHRSPPADIRGMRHATAITPAPRIYATWFEPYFNGALSLPPYLPPRRPPGPPISRRCELRHGAMHVARTWHSNAGSTTAPRHYSTTTAITTFRFPRWARSLVRSFPRSRLIRHCSCVLTCSTPLCSAVLAVLGSAWQCLAVLSGA